MSDENRQTRSQKSKQNKPRSKEKRRGITWWTWVKGILLAILVSIIIGLAAGLGLFMYYAKDTPEITMQDLRGTYASDLVDKDGNVFYTLGADEREFATADEYPRVLIDAVMAIEDQRFLEHQGIDPIGIGRAAWGILTNRGQIVGGGSTITQQLVKLSVFSTLQEDQTLERKAQEAVLAIQLEQELSKEQIMTLYLNKVHMGGNIYGMATAAKQYYGKHVSQLDLHEAALLAGMPKAPNYYNPRTDPEAAKNRRDTVLEVMYELELITREQATQAQSIPVTEGLIEPQENQNTLVFDGYITTILKEIQEKTDFDPYTAGLRIETNLDMNIQNALYQVGNTYDYVNYRDDEMQVAFTVVEPGTGKLLGILGGRNSQGQLSENRAINMQRSVASTIKPLTVYGPAFEFEQFDTYHPIKDEPYSVGSYSPQNYDQRFKGWVSLREALVDSRNVPALKIFDQDLNWDEVSQFLTKLGIDPVELNPGAQGLVPSNAINGTMTPLQLAGAFGAFASDGIYAEPYAVSKIITQAGEEIDLSSESSRAMEDYTAYMITDILKDAVERYGEPNVIPGVVHAGKTGTTNYTAEQFAQYGIPYGAVPDSWYVGYSKSYVISSWVGYDEVFKEGHYLSLNDGTWRLARIAAMALMSLIHEGKPSSDWEMPASVGEMAIIENSFPPKRATRSTSSQRISRELYVKGHEPNFGEYKEEEEEEEEKENVTLPQPSNVSARYVAESHDVAVSWTPYNHPDGKDVQYIINVNGQSNTVNGTNIVIDNPPEGAMNIQVAIRVDGETGPSTSLNIVVPANTTAPPSPPNPEEQQTPADPPPEDAGNAPPEEGDDSPENENR